MLFPSLLKLLSSKLRLTLKGLNLSEYQGNALADFHVRAVATKSIKIMALVNEVHSASQNDRLLPDFCHPDVLVTWQQSAPESEKLR